MNIINNDDNHYININNTQDSYLITRMNESEIKECRICLEDEEDDSKLIIPCKCKGTHKYVHKYCLHKWRHTNDDDITNVQILYNRRERCGICKTRYREKKIYPMETYYLTTSSRHIITLYLLASFVFSFIIGIQEYHTGFIIKSLTDEPKIISMYQNVTSSDHNIFNTFVYSYTSHLLNIILFVLYISFSVKNINRYKLFIYNISPLLTYLFFIFVASHRGLFYLLKDFSLYMYMYLVIFIYILAPFNYCIIKNSHNNILDKMNNRDNPSTVLPYDPESSFYDDEEYTSDDGEIDNDNQEEEEEEQNNQEEEEQNNQEEEEQNNQEEQDRYIIDIEEELLALEDITEEELFIMLKREYEKEINKKIHPKNESNEDSNSEYTDSEESNSSQEGESMENKKISSDIPVKKSKYVIQPSENLKQENKKIFKNVNIELVHQKSKIESDAHKKSEDDKKNKIEITHDDFNKKITLNDVVLMDIEEDKQDEECNSEEYCEKVIQNSINNTIDQIIQEVLNEKYKENSNN